MMLTTSSKVNAAKKYAANGQYAEAADIAERINYEKVSSIHELKVLANIFLHTAEYDLAKTVYLEMYHRSKSHRIIVGLIDLCLKTQEPKEAEKYIREFRKMEPENPERLIFRYRVDVMLGKSNEYLLKSLTKLKEEDYSDIWGLELAKIYFKENDIAACAKECRDLLLWFPDSEIVPKVKVLLGACEDILEVETESNPTEIAVENQSVEVVEITNDSKASPVYDRIIYDDDEDDDEDEYVIRDYFPGDGEAAASTEETVIIAAESEEEPKAAPEAGEKVITAEEPKAVPEAGEKVITAEEPKAVPEAGELTEEEPEKESGKMEEPALHLDASVMERMEEPSASLEAEEDWMKDMDIYSFAMEQSGETTTEEKAPASEENTEKALTDAALAAVLQEDDIAIERALYGLLKKK